MIAEARQYYYLLEQQHALLENAANTFEAMIPSGDEAELAETNYSAIAYQLWIAILKNEQLQKLHRFNRMTKEQMLRALAGESANSTTTITHVVKSIDTLDGIARQYGTTIEDIVRANNREASILLEQAEIIVPINAKSQLIVYDVLTIDSHEGVKVMGKDISNTMEIDSTGDARALTEVQTFEQGVGNLIKTERGTIVLDPTFGAAPEIGKEFPSQAVESFLGVEVIKALNQDKRIRDIKGLSVTKQPMGYVIQVDVASINSKDYIKAVNS